MKTALESMAGKEGVARYCAVAGSRITDEQARLAGEALEELAAAGRLDNETIVASAPGDERLRGHFTWDDAVAAHRYRLTEADYLLRSIAVEFASTDGDEAEPVRVRAFHVVDLAPENGPAARSWVPVEVVVGRRDLAEQVIDAARRELAAFERKYGRYLDAFDARAPELARVLRVLSAAT